MNEQAPQNKEDVKGQAKASKGKPKRNKKGQLLPGHTANPEGMTPLTKEQSLQKKAEKTALEQYAVEFKESLGSSLHLISPILVKKALEGDIQAIKEVISVVIEKGSTKVDLNVRGAIAHGHALYPEDDLVHEEIKQAITAKHLANMRARIKAAYIQINFGTSFFNND